MGLREIAGLDLIGILQDRTTGFGWDLTVTNPAGLSLAVIGFSTDIGMSLDVETGVFIAGRKASVAIPIAALMAAGFGIPRGIADTSSKPWLIRFNDIHGRSHLFKVQESMPDTAIGCVTCLLESYRGPSP